MVNSRAKGKRGELEFAHFLSEHGIAARRGQQFSGGGESPDVVADLPGYHIEVKRVESLNIDKAMEQAQADAGGKTPLVAHRRNKKPWKITLLASDFVRMLTDET